MKERPILFSSEMVRAILDGRKSQTRRVIKVAKYSYVQRKWYGPHPNSGWWGVDIPEAKTPDQYDIMASGEMGFPCPYGVTGDRLWVRETFHQDTGLTGNTVHYKADGGNYSWRPSIFMPRWASRITLEIVNVRVQQVQNITPDDVLAEGIRVNNLDSFRSGLRPAFHDIWDSINAKRGYSWDVNPWVWVIEFKRIDHG